jgi:poly-gamma-glutamate biosynthesis protein PgsC/CapC
MHNYGLPTEDVRLALALGVLLSILAYERWRLTGGAAVVAGYLAMFINRPLYIVTTILLSIVTYYLVQNYIARKVFLYGRRRLVVMVLIGMALQFLTGLIAYFGSTDAPWLVGLYGVGFVLPGLIAQDVERQGMRLTVLTVLGTSALTFLLLQSFLAIRSNLPVFWHSIAFVDRTVVYSYHTQLLIPAVILSVVVSALMFEWTNIRSGGFLTAGYAALFVLKPLHLLVLGLIGVATYYLVTRFLMRRTPIFGRTKFAMMVLTGLVLTWSVEVALGAVTHNVFVLFAGFSVISPMIVALIANDSERQGLPKTLIGAIVATLIVFVAIKGADLLLIG